MNDLLINVAWYPASTKASTCPLSLISILLLVYSAFALNMVDCVNSKKHCRNDYGWFLKLTVKYAVVSDSPFFVSLVLEESSNDVLSMLMKSQCRSSCSHELKLPANSQKHLASADDSEYSEVWTLKPVKLQV